MTKYQYHPMHMHIHTCFQPGASIAMQMYNAQKLGMEYIWLTDHDNRMGAKKMPVEGFVFDSESLIKQETEKDYFGFEITEYERSANLLHNIDTEKKQLNMQATASDDAEWQSAGIHLVSTRARHTASLLNGVTLKMGLAAENIGENARLMIDIRLSQRPPECVRAHLLYVLGEVEGLEDIHTQILPLTMENGTVTLPISEDISCDENIGGCDNTFDTVSIVLQVRNRAELNVKIKDFAISLERHFEDANIFRKKIAAEVGSHYGVTPFVSFEISSAGEHKNCFSTHVPVIDYKKENYQVTHEQATEYVKECGGMFAVNHPLAINPLKRHSLTEKERLRVVAKMASELLANGADGARLIEVGFPMGRNNFPMEEYTMLWDLLSQGGLFLCGYGANDCHRDNVGWFDGNNFAAYIAADASLEYPIAEEVFTDSMRRGNVYTGNPCVLTGEIAFETENGHPMGTVFPRKKHPEIHIIFKAEQVKKGWEFRLIENGNVVYTETLTDGAYTHRSVLQKGLDTVRFQRAELYDENGVCILLTNPIYMVNTEQAAFEIPTERLVKE